MHRRASLLSCLSQLLRAKPLATIGKFEKKLQYAAICCNITCDICSVDLVKSLESRGLHDPVDPAGRGVQKTSPRHTDC